MQNIKTTIALAWVAVALLFVTCKKDIAPEPCTNPLNPDCVGYHPCNGVQPVTADFEMWLVYFPGGKLEYIEEDSIFPAGNIMFKAKLNGAAYQWQLGKETLTVQQDYRLFANHPSLNPPDTSVWGTYYNTLTVHKTPNLSCYSTNDTIATLTRSIIIQKPSKLLTSGKFKVLYEGDKDSTIIQFQPWEKNIIVGQPEYYTESEGQRIFIGFKDTYADTIIAAYCIFTNRTIYFNRLTSPYPGLPINGKATVNPSSLLIEGKYDIKPKNKGFITHRFKGRKL